MQSWIPVVVGLASAIASGLFARSARQSDQKATRLRDLEHRIAEHKVATYAPIFELFSRLLDKNTSEEILKDQVEYAAKVSAFAQGLAIWGSDEAMTAFQRFMQSTYLAAPAPVMMRLYVEFVLAARRDLGHPDTQLTGEQVLGVRLADYYQGTLIRPAMAEPLESVYRNNGWTPPWA